MRGIFWDGVGTPDPRELSPSLVLVVQVSWREKTCGQKNGGWTGGHHLLMLFSLKMHNRKLEELKLCAFYWFWSTHPRENSIFIQKKKKQYCRIVQNISNSVSYQTNNAKSQSRIDTPWLKGCHVIDGQGAEPSHYRRHFQSLRKSLNVSLQLYHSM